jgi:hypothetical protein
MAHARVRAGHQKLCQGKEQDEGQHKERDSDPEHDYHGPPQATAFADMMTRQRDENVGIGRRCPSGRSGATGGHSLIVAGHGEE